MAKQNRTTLKTYFQQGDIPTQGQYVDLIDSQLNLNDGGTQILSGSISASNFVSSAGISLAGTISSSGNLEIGHITSSGGISTTNLNLTHITSSGGISTPNISASLQLITDKIVTGSAAKGINLVGDITASANISASGTDYTLGSTRFLNGHITASGNISSSGTGSFAKINTGQGANELYDMNQNVLTTSDVRFNSIDIRGTTENTLYNWDGGATINSRAFSFTTAIPAIEANRNSETQVITNSEVTTNSVILATTSTNIGVHVVSVRTGTFSFYLTNTGTGTTTAKIDGIINFIIL